LLWTNYMCAYCQNIFTQSLVFIFLTYMELCARQDVSTVWAPPHAHNPRHRVFQTALPVMIPKWKDLNGAILIQGTQNVLTVWRPLDVLRTQEQQEMIHDYANELTQTTNELTQTTNELTQTTNDNQCNKDSYEKCTLRNYKGTLMANPQPQCSVYGPRLNHSWYWKHNLDILLYTALNWYNASPWFHFVN